MHKSLIIGTAFVLQEEALSFWGDYPVGIVNALSLIGKEADVNLIDLQSVGKLRQSMTYCSEACTSLDTT